MAASWACGLDISPPKVTLVVANGSKTRELIERSGEFVLQVPTARQAALTLAVGSRSLAEEPDKLVQSGVELFRVAGVKVPFVAGCAAWLYGKVVPEPHVQSVYDLFIGEVIGAWADGRIFKDGHWDYENAGPEWRSLHYIAGGHFYAIGDAIRARPAGHFHAHGSLAPGSVGGLAKIARVCPPPRPVPCFNLEDLAQGVLCSSSSDQGSSRLPTAARTLATLSGETGGALWPQDWRM